MSGRSKTIIAGVFFSLIVLVGAVVAVLTAFKQNTTAPVAPTVPQVTPHAQEPATTAACKLGFTVATPSSAICDSLTANPTSGTAPITVNFTLSGHATPTGTIVNYKFDFGDGTAPVGQAGNTISHTYVTDGTFTAKGTVTDSAGNVSPDIAACQKTITPGSVTYKFKKCENNACTSEDCVPKTTPCSGLSTCTSDSDCQPKFKHNVCLGETCTSVDCSPPTVQCGSTCTSDANCIPRTPPPVATPSATHRECQNQACVLVAGTGTSTCTSDVSCRPAAVAPPIPRSGNTLLTIAGVVLGVGAVMVGLLLL
ncbi:PKD domain-containing protein [Candidatus Microgenomates bacterium]|nr:PKD domain-containing protein [Candidatus Microgenomates bacterium]